MQTAIPFVIHLYPRETEEWFTPPEELLARLTSAFPDAELDKERGKREVLEHMQEMLDMGTPEIIVQGHLALAELTTFVAVRWDHWPNNRVSAHVSGIESDGRLVFSCESHDFEFLKFAARELAAAFAMDHSLQTPHYDSVETKVGRDRLTPLSGFAIAIQKGIHQDRNGSLRFRNSPVGPNLCTVRFVAISMGIAAATRKR